MKYTENFFNDYKEYTKVPENTKGNWEKAIERSIHKCVGDFGQTIIRYVDNNKKVWRNQTMAEFYRKE